MNDTVYSSVFKKELQDLVGLKRALGFAYHTEACAFRRIDSFFIENRLSTKCVTKELCDLWCRKKSHESVTNQAARISTLRVFCRYLDDIGIPAYIPSKGLVRKCARYDAHIYTDEELKKFFAAVDKSQSVPGECPYRGEVMPVFFRILYTSGMRVSEFWLARVRDFNPDQGCITVQGAKNHKDRTVPLHPLLTARCIELKKKIHSSSPEDEYFFMNGWRCFPECHFHSPPSRQGQ